MTTSGVELDEQKGEFGHLHVLKALKLYSCMSGRKKTATYYNMADFRQQEKYSGGKAWTTSVEEAAICSEKLGDFCQAKHPNGMSTVIFIINLLSFQPNFQFNFIFEYLFIFRPVAAIISSDYNAFLA